MAMVTILASCINLKIGKDLLKISTDGVEIVKGGATEVEQADDDSTNEDGKSKY